MKKEKIYSICAIILLVDQFLKTIITLKMKVGQVLVVIPHVFNIHYVRNTGAAFSILEGGRYLFIMFALFVFWILIKYIRKTKFKKKIELISLGLLMGGLIGNLIDRILYGYVIDYLSFFSCPIFNIADIAVVCGVFFLMIELFQREKGKKDC